MSFPNYVHIPAVATVPHCVIQLKAGDLIESRLGENRVTGVHDDGVKSILTINTTHGLIATTAEQEWYLMGGVWARADSLTPGNFIAYYFGDKYSFVQVNSLGLIKPDRTYKLTTEKGEYVAAGHVTRG